MRKIIFISIILVIVIFLSGNSDVVKPQPNFSKTYEEESLPISNIPFIINSHPRLIIRKDHWARGPNLADLRDWAKIDPLNSYLKQKPWNPKPGLEWAFRYLLTGDESYVSPIIKSIKEMTFYYPGFLTQVAILYDWLYNSPSFSDDDKKLIEEKMVAWAEQAAIAGKQAGDMWSHFGYRPLTDIAAAGLALFGHRLEGKKYIAWAGGYLKRNMMLGWALNDGAWQGGWNYYSQGCAHLFSLIELWSSATSEDLFEHVRQSQGDWIRSHLYYLIYTMYPDSTPVDSSGFSYHPKQNGSDSVILRLAAAYQDPEGIRELRRRNLWGWQLGIDQFLYYSPQLKQLKLGPPRLPLTKCWGREGIGYVQMRSGWGDDDTIIEFKCGDYFWSHQFQNQNSFTIYKKGRLAIQSGIYDRYFGNHTQSYYRPTISSNSIIVIQPGEKSWIPPAVAKTSNITSENGFISEWGGQRTCYMIPEYGSAETCFTFEKYLYKKNHQHHFETGHIKAFEVTDRYSYVYGDATMAYNNPSFTYPGNKPKIDLSTRELVFLDKKYLVIFDRVNALDTAYEKRWLLHSIGEPQFRKKPSIVEYPLHREVYESDLVRIDNQGGTLYSQTLFPDDYYIRKVGGGATITDAKAGQANKGNASITTHVQGKYEQASSTIATDKAQNEDWVIEFIDTEHFKIRGSVTGEDGIGSFSSPKAGIFISDSQSIFIPKENWKGTPQKNDKFYFSVKSPSNRFWANGRNQYPDPKMLIALAKTSHLVPGNWRIEVIPKTGRKFDTFLHLLYPCDSEKAVPPEAVGIISSNSIMKGVQVENWIVFFGHKGAVDQATVYSIKTGGEANNLLLDMKPEKPYLINITNASKGSDKMKITASKEGTIFFPTVGPCRVDITPL